MTLRTRTDEVRFSNGRLVARTYRTFSERKKIVPKKRTPAVVFVDIEVKNGFRVCFGI